MMEQLPVQDRQLDDILARLARADDAVTVLDEELAPVDLPGGIEGIERLSPEMRAAALYRHLREIRATGVGPRLRLERVVDLSPLIVETVSALMVRPVTTSDRRMAISMPIALLKCRYDIKRQAVVQSVRLPRADASLATDSILATFTALFDLLVCYWIQHLPPLERFWAELHALYQLAAHAGADSSGQAVTAATRKAVSNAYLKPLLLGSLGPARFNVGEIRQLVAFVEAHVSLAQLGTTNGQQHRLVQHRHAGPAQQSDSGGDLRVQLIGVIDMQYQAGLEAGAGQPSQALGIDAGGNDHGQAGMHAQAHQMGDRSELFGQPGEQGIAGGEGIAPAENDFGDRCVATDVVERFLPAGAPRRVRGVVEMTAETVAAVDGARRAQDQQHTARILVDQPRDRVGGALFQRILAVPGGGTHLGACRQHLQQQWIAGIAARHTRNVGAWHAQRKLRTGGVRNAEIRERQIEQCGQFARVPYGSREFLVPVERLPRRDALLYHGDPRIGPVRIDPARK